MPVATEEASLGREIQKRCKKRRSEFALHSRCGIGESSKTTTIRRKKLERLQDIAGPVDDFWLYELFDECASQRKIGRFPFAKRTADNEEQHTDGDMLWTEEVDLCGKIGR